MVPVIPNHIWTEWQGLVKTLPSPTSLAGGNKVNYNEYHLKQIYELNEIIHCKRDIVHVKTLVNSLNEFAIT